MRRLSIPQKPDRPDIDDLILVMTIRRRAKSNRTFVSVPRRACRETAAAWFFIPVFERKHIKMESSSPASRTKM